MSDDKVEGNEKKCGKCKEDLIVVKITKEWQGKTDTKLQWQTKSTGKAHFKYAGPGKYNCIIPTPEDVKPEPTPEAKPEPKEVNPTIKVSGPFDEAELIARWAGEKAYKIVMKDVHDFSKLTQQEKSGLGQKEGMYTRLLADTVLELMKQHGIKTEYSK